MTRYNRWYSAYLGSETEGSEIGVKGNEEMFCRIDVGVPRRRLSVSNRFSGKIRLDE